MAIAAVFLLFLLPFSLAADPSPYLSPSIFPRTHRHMLSSFKIFAYDYTPNSTTTTNPFSLSSSAAVFHAALLRSPFLTTDPESAHLFYLPVPSRTSPRSIGRLVRSIRSQHPFWDRALGADHFFLSEDGVGVSSDRNLVELRKNAIQISPFPAATGRFIPHKDLTLPSPVPHDPRILKAAGETFRYLAFYGGGESPGIAPVLRELRKDPDFFIGSGEDDAANRAEKMSSSRFCLFFYGAKGQASIGEALAVGCVPVLVTNGPVLDLPFGDVLRWGEIAVVVRASGGAREVKAAVGQACGDGRHKRMREMGVKASVHFRWAEDVYDAFHTVMYQLWQRRHVIRYPRRELSAQ